MEAKKEWIAWDEAVSAYSDESPKCVEAVIDHEINLRSVLPGEGGVLWTDELHRVWQEVGELDLVMLRTVLMHQPNFRGDVCLHNYAALLVYQRMVGWALSPVTLGPTMRGT